MVLGSHRCTRENYILILAVGSTVDLNMNNTDLHSPRWRCWNRKVLTLFFIAIVIFVCYYFLSTRNYARYTGHHPLQAPMKCRNLTDTEIQQLLNFAYKIHKFLEEMGVEHWLMYGSLLGSLRKHAPLIWDDDADFGIDGDGRLSKIGKTEFLTRIKAVKGVKEVVDHWSRDSQVQVFDANSEFHIDLMIFRRSGSLMMRSGWITWLLHFQYKRFHSFPAKLVQQPLPKTRFGFFSISVPRDGNEILKYIYPTDWWKVIKPSEC